MAEQQEMGAGMQVAETHHRIPGAAFNFMHDILVTENYYILIENPTRCVDFRAAARCKRISADTEARYSLSCLRLLPVTSMSLKLFHLYFFKSRLAYLFIYLFSYVLY